MDNRNAGRLLPLEELYKQLQSKCQRYEKYLNLIGRASSANIKLEGMRQILDLVGEALDRKTMGDDIADLERRRPDINWKD